MKKTTCKNLGGACLATILGKDPEDMGNNCKQHVIAMVQVGDQAHLSAIAAWKEKSPAEMKQWFDDFAKGFDDLEDAE